MKPADLFARRLNDLMRSRNLTVSALARDLFGEIEEERTSPSGQRYTTKAARKRQVVAAWARGDRLPWPEHQMLLANYFGVPLADLVDRTPLDGFAMGEPDSEGMVHVTMSMSVPKNIAEVIRELVRNYRP